VARPPAPKDDERRPDENASLLREVDDDLAEERLFGLIRRYGPAALIAAGVAVVGVAIFQFQAASSERAAQSAGAAYLDALERYAEDDPAPLRTIADERSGAYGALAALRLAAASAEEGDVAAARERYDDVVASAPTRRLRNYARVRLGYLLVDSDPDAARFIVGEIEGEAGAFAPFLREIEGLAALRQERWAPARDIFEALAADLASPPALSARAEQFAAFARSSRVAPEQAFQPADLEQALGLTTGGRAASEKTPTGGGDPDTSGGGE